METVVIVILSFFAAYGIVQLVVKGMLSIRLRECEEDILSYRMIALQNCEDRVEGLIRSIAWEDIRDDLIVVDLGSTDETPEILERLGREFTFLSVMNPEEYREYCNEMLYGYTE
ncbi:MAG: hypothetical protein J6A56_03070 [Clostridia bacterium]|nr:hypothetical protein [Clostridia bacterium]